MRDIAILAEMGRASSTDHEPSSQPRISVGIGSWADAEYTGVLYPKGLPSTERLKTYATHFDHVEVNSSAYRTPKRDVVAEWVSQTPPDFTFDVKLHRTFSDTPQEAVQKGDFVSYWLANMQPLIETKKLGAFLLVLPSRFGPKRNRLEELDLLVDKFAPHLIAVELRNRGWVEGPERGRTLTFFRERKLVWVAVDMPSIEGSTIMPRVDEVTNPQLAYLRLHGRNPEWTKVKTTEERHTYDYPEEELKEIATRVRGLAEKSGKIHVVANNHAQDFAPKAALGLKRALNL
jgi:uncharacterized protein YecE (DUF72 family)